MNDAIIYHGSDLNVERLQPTNMDKKIEPILGTTDREKAVEKGLKAVLEKTHKLKNFSYENGVLNIELDVTSPILTVPMLEKLCVYLYASKLTPTAPWKRIDKDGVPSNCFASEKPINPMDKARIQMNIWLRQTKIRIKHIRF